MDVLRESRESGAHWSIVQVRVTAALSVAMASGMKSLLSLMVYFIFLNTKIWNHWGKMKMLRLSKVGQWVQFLLCDLYHTKPLVTTQAFPHLTPGQCWMQVLAPLGLGTLSPFGPRTSSWLLPKAIWQSLCWNALFPQDPNSVMLSVVLCLFSLRSILTPKGYPTHDFKASYMLDSPTFLSRPDFPPEVQVCMSCPLRGREASHTDKLHLLRV